MIFLTLTSEKQQAKFNHFHSIFLLFIVHRSTNAIRVRLQIHFFSSSSCSAQVARCSLKLLKKRMIWPLMPFLSYYLQFFILILIALTEYNKIITSLTFKITQWHFHNVRVKYALFYIFAFHLFENTDNLTNLKEMKKNERNLSMNFSHCILANNFRIAYCQNGLRLQCQGKRE